MVKRHKTGAGKPMRKNAPAKGNSGQGGCGPEGDPRSSKAKQREDLLKNRSTAPTKFNKNATLEKLVAPSQNDETRWKETDGATVTGYLAEAHYGSKESCNCHSNDPNMWDIHVALVTKQDHIGKDFENERFITELTRYFPNLRKVWTPEKLQQYIGKKITVTGWLFFDPDHMHEAENTSPGGHHNWRATAWEIHPITSIKLG